MNNRLACLNVPVFLFIVVFICLFSLDLQAQNFASKLRNSLSLNENALGFGYFNEPVVYKYKDASKENYLSNYTGWLIKYARYFGSTSAIQVHYLQARGEENIRALSGSLVYGLNLNRPGVGVYIGASYTLKQRTQFVGEQRVSNEKEYGWDYPIGVQVQNSLFIISFETRYKHFVLQGNNIEADSVRFPLYFSVLATF